MRLYLRQLCFNETILKPAVSIRCRNSKNFTMYRVSLLKRFFFHTKAAFLLLIVLGHVVDMTEMDSLSSRLEVIPGGNPNL